MSMVAVSDPMRHRCAPTNGVAMKYRVRAADIPSFSGCRERLLWRSSASPKRLSRVAAGDLMRHRCAPANGGYYEVSCLRRDVNGAAEGISLSLGVSAIQDVGNR